MAADAPNLWGRPMITDPGEHGVDRIEAPGILGRRPFDHDDFDTERAGGGDLRLGRRATAVLGDEHLDALLLHQRNLVLDAKRPPGENQPMGGQSGHSVRVLDGSHEVMVMGRSGEGGQLQCPDRQENSSGRFAERENGRFHVRDAEPAIASLLTPGRSGQNRERDCKVAAGDGRVLGHLGGEGMSRVDDRGDPPLDQIGLESGNAAESADTEWDRRWSGAARSAGERQDRIEIVASGDPSGECACLRRSAENEKSHRFDRERSIH